MTYDPIREHTPTTADMRHGYIVTSMRYTPETDDHLLAKRRREVAEEFDRWIAAELNAARAEAWRIGYTAGMSDEEGAAWGHLTRTDNPYLAGDET